MTDDYSHTDLTLHGKFTDDGEYFKLFVLLNGVPIWVLQTVVASQREAFDEAAKAGAATPEEEGTAETPATDGTEQTPAPAA